MIFPILLVYIAIGNLAVSDAATPPIISAIPPTAGPPEVLMEPSSECTIFFQAGVLKLDCGNPPGRVNGVNYTIKVLHAFYGWGNDHYNCHYGKDDCIVSMQPLPTSSSLSSSSSPSLTRTCDGRQTCFVNVEPSANNAKCASFGFNDYMQIEYKCVPDYSFTPKTPSDGGDLQPLPSASLPIIPGAPPTAGPLEVLMEPSSECTIFFRLGVLKLDCGNPPGRVNGVNYIIKVLRAFYGWGNDHYNCHYGDGDCIVSTQPLPASSSSSSSSSPFSTRTCDGRRTCFAIVEQSSNTANSCKSFGFHDYMQVEYKCVPDHAFTPSDTV